MVLISALLFTTIVRFIVDDIVRPPPPVKGQNGLDTLGSVQSKRWKANQVTRLIKYLPDVNYQGHVMCSRKSRTHSRLLSSDPQLTWQITWTTDPSVPDDVNDVKGLKPTRLRQTGCRHRSNQFDKCFVLFYATAHRPPQQIFHHLRVTA